VEALEWQPGVYSARYAGEHGNHAANNQKLLNALKTADTRNARFRTVLCLIRKDGVHYFEGVVNGTIATEHNGNQGFGYDPLFIPDGYGKTFAQMSLAEKNGMSHRAKALEKLTQFIESVV